MRFILPVLILGVITWLGLHQCTGLSRNTLVIKPSASFPEEKKQNLGRTVARILPHCPGFQRLGAVLEFTDLAEEDGVTILRFTAPDSREIPAEWQAGGSSCSIRVTEREFELESRASCQALCLGQPGTEGRIIKKNLNAAAAQ